MLLRRSSKVPVGRFSQPTSYAMLNRIDLQPCPGLFRLLRNENSMICEDGVKNKFSCDGSSIIWRKLGLHIFTSDIAVSEIYTHFLNQITLAGSGVTLASLNVQGKIPRAAAMLGEAEKLDCREFVTANDVAAGNYKFNLAFMANLFNKHPMLPDPEAWKIDSVDPFVNWLYGDYETVRTLHKLRGMMDQIQNCNYAVELGKQLMFSLVGLQEKDIYDGNQNLTLALVWNTETSLLFCRFRNLHMFAQSNCTIWKQDKTGAVECARKHSKSWSSVGRS